MAEALAVYLDSQDFSRFSPAHNDYSKLLPVRQALLDLKSRGIARFVFSDVHVYESLPIDPSNPGPGLERIRTIAEFCGSNNLPSAITLVEHELRGNHGNLAEPLQQEWFPYFSIDAPDRKQINEEAIANVATNRWQRRVAKRALRRPKEPDKNGRFADEFISKYPFLGGGRKIMQAYFSGRASWNEVESMVRGGLRDIVGFSEWLVNNWTHGRAFVETLRTGNSTTQRALIELFAKMQVTFATHQMPVTDAARIVRTSFEGQREKVFPDFLRKTQLKVLGATAERPILPTAHEAPSLFSAVGFLAEVAYLSALPQAPRNPGKKAASDFADALHVLFLPRVDIFRADHFSCSVLSKIAIPGGATLCNSLSELPAHIEQQAALRRLG